MGALGHAQQLGGELGQAHVGDDGGEALPVGGHPYQGLQGQHGLRVVMATARRARKAVQEGGVKAGGGGGADLGAGRVCAVPQHLDGGEGVLPSSLRCPLGEGGQCGGGRGRGVRRGRALGPVVDLERGGVLLAPLGAGRGRGADYLHRWIADKRGRRILSFDHAPRGEFSLFWDWRLGTDGVPGFVDLGDEAVKDGRRLLLALGTQVSKVGGALVIHR